MLKAFSIIISFIQILISVKKYYVMVAISVNVKL